MTDGFARFDTINCAFEVYNPSPPWRSAITLNAFGTFGSGMTRHPVGTGSTMLSAVNPAAFWGSSTTPFSFKYSARVPDVAGARVGTGVCTGAAADWVVAATAAGGVADVAATAAGGVADVAADGVAAGSAA